MMIALAEGPSGPEAPHVLHRRAAADSRRRSSGTASSPPSPTSPYNSHSLAFALDGRRSDRPNLVDRDIYVAMNAYAEPLDFKIPAAPSGRPWRRVVDTALPSPDDIVDEDRRAPRTRSPGLSRAGPRHDHPRLGRMTVDSRSVLHLTQTFANRPHLAELARSTRRVWQCVQIEPVCGGRP